MTLKELERQLLDLLEQYQPHTPTDVPTTGGSTMPYWPSFIERRVDDDDLLLMLVATD